MSQFVLEVDSLIMSDTDTHAVKCVNLDQQIKISFIVKILILVIFFPGVVHLSVMIPKP